MEQILIFTSTLSNKNSMRYPFIIRYIDLLFIILTTVSKIQKYN